MPKKGTYTKNLTNYNPGIIRRIKYVIPLMYFFVIYHSEAHQLTQHH